MPELVPKNYDPNSGEWFPYGGDESDNPGARTRAMYFFHSSLGQVVANQSITFTDEITTGGAGGGSGWTGKQSDVETWPITDNDDDPIETYSNGSACYRYRIRPAAVNLRWHINHPPGWDLSLGNVENQTGVSDSDAEIYKRYVDAFEFIFDGSTTKSIRLELDRPGDDSPSEQMAIDVPLTYTDPDGVERICDGSYDQTMSGGNNNVGYHCRSLPTKFQWFERIGGAGDDAQGGEGLDEDGVWTWGSTLQWDEDSTCGLVNFNRVPLGGAGGGSPETQTGQFIVGDVVENYVAGDYLLLESPTNNDHLFHERVVFVTENPFETSLGFAISVETLDDQGFQEDDEDEELTNFTITKLTNAPKLKVKYRMPENTGSSIVVTDDIEDVE